MATRMQQRRGTATQWTTANPILGAGEIGYETDTAQFKIGDGINHWATLSYFKNLEDLDTDGFLTTDDKAVANGLATLDSTGKIPVGQLGNLIDGAPNLLNTLNEISAAINDDENFGTTVLDAIGQEASDRADAVTNAIDVANGYADSLIENEITYRDLAITAAIDQEINDRNSAIETLGDSLTQDISDITGQIILDLGQEVSDRQTAITTEINDRNTAISNAIDLEVTNRNNAITYSVGEEASDRNIAISDAIDSALTTAQGYATTAQENAEGYADSSVATHEAVTLNVHGIASTAALATQTNVTDAVDNHNSDITNVHGIADTSELATRSYADQSQTDAETTASGYVSTHNSDTTNVHGISDTAALATKSYADTAEADAITAAGTAADTKISTAVAALTKSSVGLANVDNTADANKPVSTATQTALDAKASLSGATFTGSVEIDQNLVVDGNLTVNGTAFNASSTSIVIEDNLVQLAHSNAANTVDLGIVVGYNDGAAKHSGVVRDVSAGKWKIFKGVTTEPSTTVDFTQGSLDDLQVAALEATTVTPSSGVVFSDGTQTKEGVPSQTPIIQKTESYTLSSLTERDDLIEMDSASAITLTIPADSAVNYPIGTSLDILQTGVGMVTIAGDAGVTVNATPGLKLRTQWSSATIFKRAANTWIVYGDLKA